MNSPHRADGYLSFFFLTSILLVNSSADAAACRIRGERISNICLRDRSARRCLLLARVRQGCIALSLSRAEPEAPLFAQSAHTGINNAPTTRCSHPSPSLSSWKPYQHPSTQYAREPSRVPLVVPSRRVALLDHPLSRRLPPRRHLSHIRAPVDYSGNHPPPPLPSSESRLRSVQGEILVPSRAHDFCPFSSSIFFAVFLSFSLPLPVLTPSILFSSPLPRPHFPLARSSRRGWSRLCRDFRLFFLLAPHLPQRSSSFGVRTLFVVSPLLFVLLQPIRFITVLCPLGASLQYTYTQKHPSCVSLSPTIFHDPSSSLFSTLLASFCLCLS